ncbi:FecR family protein [Pandoraea pneumonica]|uniref:FecR family protein n=1 Tax=Pandoraea pneumonica TaxID=2508299 RepID=UPI003CEAF6A1
MPASDRIREEAALWFTRACSGEFSDADRASRDAWLAADPLHRAEYVALERVWRAAATVPAERLRALTEPALGASGMPRPNRGTATRWVAAACVGIVGIALGTLLLTTTRDLPGSVAKVAPPNTSLARVQEMSTRPGERRSVTLDDGTVVELNTRTRIQVNYTTALREVTLLSGEAMFSVTHDASRPFVVDAGSGRITVTGTRFDVRRVATQVSVAVESGAVKVQGVPSQNAPTPASTYVLLTKGLGTTVRPDGAVASASPVDLSTALAWRDGKLVFRNATLADVVSEVSLYRQSPVIVDSNTVGQLRLTSVFSADNTDELLAALPQFLPVKVQTLADGSVKISSK